jgi:hypothetical protein
LFSLLAVAVFIVQFVGLGALHFSATIIMLGVTLTMTGIRAFVRRGLANDPLCITIPEKTELVWLGLCIARDDWQKVGKSNANGDSSVLSRDCGWEVLTGFLEPRLENGTEDGISLCDLTLKEAQQPDCKCTLSDITHYVQQLNHFKLSGEQFILGFSNSDSAELSQLACPKVNAVTDSISAIPSIPLGDYADLASKLGDAIEGVTSIMELPSNIQ